MNDLSFHQIAKEITYFSHKLDAKGFVANHDGNITVRFNDNFLATPTAISKGLMRDDWIITLDKEGKKIAGPGNGKAFSEVKLHLKAYEVRPEAKAVIHAHPPFATTCGLLGNAITPHLAEAIISIGNYIPVVAMSLPGSEEQLRGVDTALNEADVFMMSGNGVLAIGDSLEQAYLRLELLEHMAQINYYLEMSSRQDNKKITTLQDNEIKSLLIKRAELGLGPKIKMNSSQAQSQYQYQYQSPSSSQSLPSADVLKTIISQEIKKMLNK
ncbi:MAG: class II aldolase/adducin family protein [Oligoflexia bacterium]|nr:class II aldolase/adducin family protein [Oligoflexia bacterium]